MASSSSAVSGSSTAIPSSAASASVQDFSNPYFVHSNKNPSAKIVTAVLDGSNYHGWAQAMLMVFDMKNKLGFVDGTIPIPSEQDPNFSQWKRCNNLIRSWINHAVTPEIATSVIWLTQASEVWNALRNRFSQGDYVRILQLHGDLYSLKQGDLSVTNYFTKIKILRDELCNFRPIPSCDASATGSCKSVLAFQKYREIDSVLCFLQGLNDSYNQARSQLLMLDPLPCLDKVFSVILQQERHLNIGILPNPTALAVQALPTSSHDRGKGSFKPSFFKQGHARKCTHCGRTNHIVDTCFAKHGFSPGWKSKPSVNQVFAASSNEVDDSDPSNVLSGLSKDQVQVLIALLPTSKPTATSSANLVSSHNISRQVPAGNPPWLLDSGAIDHFTCSLHWFSSYHPIKPVPVTLPNGKTAVALHKGTIILTDSLILYNVLYVEQFSVNIISITKLTKKLSIAKPFSHTICVFCRRIHARR